MIHLHYDLLPGVDNGSPDLVMSAGAVRAAANPPAPMGRAAISLPPAERRRFASKCLPVSEFLPVSECLPKRLSSILPWLILTLAVFVAACAPSPYPAQSGTFTAALALAGSAPPADAASVAEYMILPEDVLDVSVFQVPELNRTVVVDGTGMVSLPLIGGVRAGGRSVREVEAEVTGRLGDRYLQSPQVTILLKDALGQRITVYGAVKQPKVVSARGEMTLLRVIAEAQGLTETANPAGIIILRDTAAGRMAARFDVNAIRIGTLRDPRVFGGDTIIVDESNSRIAWKSVREALPVVGVFALFL